MSTRQFLGLLDILIVLALCFYSYHLSGKVEVRDATIKELRLELKMTDKALKNCKK